MLFCFCTTIIAGVLSKGATFIMVSQLAPDVPREVCSQKFNLLFLSWRIGYFYQVYQNIQGVPKRYRLQENSKTSDQMPIQRCVKGQGGAHKCRHIGNKCQTSGYGMDVLKNQYYPYFECSKTCKSEQYYIPKDDIILGHPVDNRTNIYPSHC